MLTFYIRSDLQLCNTVVSCQKGKEIISLSSQKIGLRYLYYKGYYVVFLYRHMFYLNDKVLNCLRVARLRYIFVTNLARVVSLTLKVHFGIFRLCFYRHFGC